MALFNFTKKKEQSCSCGGNCGVSNAANARFIVLGACCKRATETFENTKIAVRELGLNDEVVNIADNVEIARYGVMQTPALVINSKVVAYGKLLSVEDVKKLIEANM